MAECEHPSRVPEIVEADVGREVSFLEATPQGMHHRVVPADLALIGCSRGGLSFKIRRSAR